MYGYTDWCRDDIFLLVNPEVNISLVPFTKSLWDFWTGFLNITENNLCDKHKFMIQHILFINIIFKDVHHFVILETQL